MATPIHRWELSESGPRNPLPTGSRIMALRYTEELYPPETVAQLLGELRDRGCAPPRPSPTYLLPAPHQVPLADP